MWWIHKASGSRQFAAPGSRVAIRFERSKAWQPEEGADEAPAIDHDQALGVLADVARERIERTLTAPVPARPPTWADVTAMGGGWFMLPDGSKAQGKAAVAEALGLELDDAPTELPVETGGE